MTILEFYNQVVTKTILVTPDRKYNLAHMGLGFMSELTAEFIEANKSEDIVNIKEEIGDAEWFALGWAHFEDLVIPPYEKMDITKLDDHDSTEVLIIAGNIATVIKNEIIKDSPKLNGKVLTKNDKQELFEKLLTGIQLLAHLNGFDITEIRQMIAKKLNVRYNGGGFTAEQSIDRDVEAERKVMEDNQTIMDFGDEQ